MSPQKAGHPSTRYERLAAEGRRLWVREGALKFRIWLDGSPRHQTISDQSQNAGDRWQGSRRAPCAQSLWVHRNFQCLRSPWGCGMNHGRPFGRCLTRRKKTSWRISQDFRASSGVGTSLCERTPWTSYKVLSVQALGGISWCWMFRAFPRWGVVGASKCSAITHVCCSKSVHSCRPAECSIFPTNHQDFSPAFPNFLERRGKELTAQSTSRKISNTAAFTVAGASKPECFRLAVDLRKA